MFNPRRVLRFWLTVLRWVVPLFGVLALLALLALSAGETFAAGWKVPVGLALGLVPAVLAIVGAFAVAIPFMQRLYALKNKREIFFYLVHCMFGQAQFRPWLLLEEGKISPMANGPDSLIVQVGGPGNLVIRKDTAAVLEQGGRLTRVEGPGFPKLGRMERVYDVIDLRPRRWVYVVSGMSKEGIPLEVNADIEFQISSGGAQATGKNPYPMDPAAVFVAATGKWIREANRPEPDRVMDWKGRIIISATEGTLRFILARYPLDRLIAPEREGQEHPRETICRELEAELIRFSRNVGAKILKVELGQIKVTDAVTQQWIESWRADWHRWETEHLARAEAAFIETVGGAESEVVVRRISDIANTLAVLAEQGRSAFVAGALSELYRAIGKMDADSLAMTYMPAEATRMLRSGFRLSLGAPPDSDSRVGSSD